MSIAAYHAGATERLHAIVAVVCKFHGRDLEEGNGEFIAALTRVLESDAGLAQRNAAIASASDADVRRRIEEVDKAVEGLVEMSWLGQVNPDWSRAQFRLRDSLRALEPFAVMPSATADVPATPAVQPSPADTLKGEAKAVALLVAHPDWSDTDIAKAVPCHRTTLYSWNKFTAARGMLDKGRQSMPRGSKDAETGDVEAWE
jgi:hypothetical protein